MDMPSGDTEQRAKYDNHPDSDLAELGKLSAIQALGQIEGINSWHADDAIQCIQAKISKTLDKRSTLIFAAFCTEQKLSSSESYYLTPNL